MKNFRFGLVLVTAFSISSISFGNPPKEFRKCGEEWKNICKVEMLAPPEGADPSDMPPPDQMKNKMRVQKQALESCFSNDLLRKKLSPECQKLPKPPRPF